MSYPTEYSGRGWRDYALGQPYPREYDTWCEKDQRNYENGRMRAANFQLASQRPLPSQHPPQRAYLAMIDRVGPAFFKTGDPNSIPIMRHSRQRAAR